MASLKRDTPAGRAALARRRQRAAAVVENSSRFLNADDDDGIGTSEDSNNQSPVQEEQDQYVHVHVHNPIQSSHQSRNAQPDPPQQQQQQQQQLPPPPPPPKGRLKDPPPTATTTSSKSASYSAASLPSSDELLERSSQVAQAAASVLASARKNKQPQRTYVYNNSGVSTGGNSTGSDANNHNKFVERLGQERAGTTSITGSGFGSPSHRQPSFSQAAAASKESKAASETTLSAFNKLEQMAMPASTNQDNPAHILIFQHQQESQRIQGEQQHVQQQKEQQSQSTATRTMPKPKATLASRVGFHSPTLEEYINENDDTMVHHTSQAGSSKDNDHHHFHNHQNHHEEEITMEESEPVISRQTEYEVLDAACVVSGSLIMLRSLATSATVTTTIPSQEESACESVAFVGGSGLAQDEEIFQLFKVDTQDMHRGSILENLPLRWGDTVAILSPTLLDPTNDYLPKALGIKKRSNPHSNSPLSYQIGWFRSTLGQAETWTILRARDSSQHGLRVGLAALRTTKIIQERRAARAEYTRAVHSGDPIVLRNNQTGGILTVFMEDGSLTLVTDSYGHNLRNNNSLLGQLQQHDRYLPTDQDTFALIKSNVPPCPRWVLAGGTSSSCNQSYNPLGHRIYLHNTYLSFPNRKNASKALQETLFGSQWSSLSMLDDHERPLEPMNLRDQESLLMDEVIGACLGLEGKHIYAKQLDEEEISDRSNRTQIATSHKTEFALRDESCLIFDANLRNLVDKMLPLAESYVYVSTFVASHLPGYEFGSVMQAFCEALDGLLQEYATFVAELESRFRRPSTESTLTLRRLHSHLMPSLHSMSVLERAALSVRDKTGGALINALSTLKAWSCEGDLLGNKVLSILLDKSSIPYMTMLTTWLQHGLLRDPYREFMIEIKDQNSESHSVASKHSADSDFNNESYLVREAHVLGELMSSDVLLQKVVATGKYWRAVRACKKEAHSESDDETSRKPTAILQYSLSFSSISSYIQSLYESASEALVTLLIVDFNLFDALQAMKQYFLLDQGDFLVHFLDAAEDELLKESGEISTGRVQHWLRMSVQMTEDGPTRRRELTSVSANDLPQRPLSPLKLRCRFEPISLISHVDAMHLEREGKPANNNVNSARDESLLVTPSRDAYGVSNKSLTGVETFMLDFNVEFPISLVISPMAMGSYQLLFRLLFFAKYVERRLLGIWQDHQAMKELNSVRGLFGPTYLLRQRMLHFSQNLIYYMMFEVIEPNWMAMENSVMANRRTVDAIVGVHDAFLQHTLEACLLTNRELVRTLTKLMTTCLMFADQMKLFTEATRIHDESSHVAAERRKAIQRSLNDRGGGGSKAPVDKTALREAMNSFKQDRQSRLKKQKRRVGRELGSESYRRMVTRFEEVFTAYLSEFMVQLNSDAGSLYHSHKTNLQARLDYNGFLSSSIAIDKSQLQEPTSSWNKD